MYEGLVDGIVTMFKNEPRDEVATETEVKGPLDDPRASTWDILLNLVKNAFLKAMVPDQTVHSFIVLPVAHTSCDE